MHGAAPAAPELGLPRVAAPAFRVGPLPVHRRVLAAPMCGASKLPYRRLARRFGADLVFTEMVKATPLVRRCPKTLRLLTTGPEEQTVGAQICGADEATMAEAAAVAEGELGFPLVDINMGCPVRKVVRGGAGAALLRDPRRVEAMVRACVAAVSIPVTAKIRSGWDHQGHAGAAELAQAVEAGGAAMVSIHARARSQRHGGEVDLAALAAAKQAVRIPVVANGGIVTGEDARRMLDVTGCDAVMIGRGANGRPWVFRDAARALAGLTPLPPPRGDALCDLIDAHLEGMVELMGPHGVLVFRKYATWYLRGAPRSAELRAQAHRTREPAAMRALLHEWREHLRATATIAS